MPDRQAQIREFGVGVAVPEMRFRSKRHAEDETFRAVEPAVVERGCRSRRVDSLGATPSGTRPSRT
jgi:hypothetical protein